MLHIETLPMFDAFMLGITELSQRSDADSIGMTAEIWDFFNSRSPLSMLIVTSLLIQNKTFFWFPPLLALASLIF